MPVRRTDGWREPCVARGLSGAKNGGCWTFSNCGPNTIFSGLRGSLCRFSKAILVFVYFGDILRVLNT